MMVKTLRQIVFPLTNGLAGELQAENVPHSAADMKNQASIASGSDVHVSVDRIIFA
jgi:hypothetical protein